MILLKENILHFLRVNKPSFQRDFGVVQLGLLGSYARDQQAEDSDIDLLIEFAPNTDALFDKKEKIKQIVQSQFCKEVDICREKYIKPYFRKQILNSVIYV